jgi:hypothetical protein
VISKKLSCFSEINSLPHGDNVEFIATLLNIKDLSNDYVTKIQMAVFDGKETSYFQIFSSYSEIQSLFSMNTIYRFIGTVGESHGHKYFKFENAEFADLINDEDLKKYKPYEYKWLKESTYHYFVKSINLITNESYKRYVELIYGLGDPPETVSESTYRKRVNIYKKSPASLNRHDNYAGGYINHVSGIIRLIEAVQKIYGQFGLIPSLGRVELGSSIDWAYVYTLAYLHDIGKPCTYKNGLFPGRLEFREDTKLDHNAMGIVILTKMDREVESALRLSYGDFQKLAYGILCHGHRQSTVLYPIRSAEDQLFTTLDSIDAQMTDTLIL